MAISNLKQAFQDGAFTEALQRMLRSEETNGHSFYDFGKNGRAPKDGIDGIAGTQTRKGLQKWAGADDDGGIGDLTKAALRTKLGLNDRASEAELVVALDKRLHDGGFYNNAAHTARAEIPTPRTSSPGGGRGQLRTMTPAHLSNIPSDLPPASTPVPTTSDPSLTTIVLDSGHGDWVGKDTFSPGAVVKSSSGDIEERHLNSLLTQNVEKELKARGYNVVMTHSGEEYRAGNQPMTRQDSLQSRTAIAPDAAAFVSIHHNITPTVSGGQVIIYGPSEASAKFAQEMGKSIGSKNRKDADGLVVVKNENHARADGSTRAAVLFEAGDMNNAADRNRVLDPIQRQAYAQKIADGIIQGIESPEVKLATAPKQQKPASIILASNKSNMPSSSTSRLTAHSM